MNTSEYDSREAARSTLLMCARGVAMIFAYIRLRGVMNGIDLAREVKMRWPLLPVILTSGHSRERVGGLPAGVGYMAKISGADATTSQRHSWIGWTRPNLISTSD